MPAQRDPVFEILLSNPQAPNEFQEARPDSVCEILVTRYHQGAPYWSSIGTVPFFPSDGQTFGYKVYETLMARFPEIEEQNRISFRVHFAGEDTSREALYISCNRNYNPTLWRRANKKTNQIIIGWFNLTIINGLNEFMEDGPNCAR